MKSAAPLPREIIIVQLSDRFKLPFEYWDTQDINFINKLLIIIKAENDGRQKMMDDIKKKK